MMASDHSRRKEGLGFPRQEFVSVNSCEDGVSSCPQPADPESFGAFGGKSEDDEVSTRPVSHSFVRA
jgi:hypothetical protein